VPASITITGGDSSLSGLIAGPNGPVAGATVRLERFVGDAVARLDVTSNADGTWRAPQLGPPTTVPPTFSTVPGQLPSLPPITRFVQPAPTTKGIGPTGILGGRYRVRAWRAPDLALTTPQIIFLEAKQDKQLGLQLSRYTGTTASSVSSPDPPVLGAVTNITAILNSAKVDADGIVRAAPLAGATVSLSVGPGWRFTGGPSITNGAGRATFQLQCQALGQSPVDLTVNGGQTFSLPVRACVAPLPTTTTLPFGVTTPTLFGTPTTSTLSPPRT